MADSEHVVAGNFAISSQESCALILELSATTFAEPRVVNQQMKLRLLCRVLATYSRRAQGVDICMQDANTTPLPGLRLRKFLHAFRCSWHVRYTHVRVEPIRAHSELGFAKCQSGIAPKMPHSDRATFRLHLTNRRLAVIDAV